MDGAQSCACNQNTHKPAADKCVTNAVEAAFNVDTNYRPPNSEVGLISSVTLEYLGLDALVGCKNFKDPVKC